MPRKRKPKGNNNRPGYAPSGPSGAPITPQVGPAGQGGGPEFGQKGALEAAAAATTPQRRTTADLPPNGLNVPTQGVFGPTSRPNEPGTAGAPLGPGQGPKRPILDEDPDLFLRSLISEFPHPDLIRLLQSVRK